MIKTIFIRPEKQASQSTLLLSWHGVLIQNLDSQIRYVGDYSLFYKDLVT